jgi:predicted protein tyrosine phosphatase
MKKVLFVCTGNRMRSWTAHKMLEAQGGYEVRSAGTEAAEIADYLWRTKAHRDGFGGVQLTKDLADWADTIYVFEGKHLSYIQKEYGLDYTAKVINIDIPDAYDVFDPILVGILTNFFRIAFPTAKKAEPVHVQDYRLTKNRTRTTTYASGHTETDVICGKCMAIIVGEFCIHCDRAKSKKAANLQKLLDKKAAESQEEA